jgi:hypothetical protein
MTQVHTVGYSLTQIVCSVKSQSVLIIEMFFYIVRIACKILKDSSPLDLLQVSNMEKSFITNTIYKKPSHSLDGL